MISFVVPIYNAEKYIEECITSLVSQTYQDIEIILVDDGSDDKSGNICEICAKQDDRIRVIHQEKQGVSVARNRGIDEAKGEWIIFVDADDWVDTQMCMELNCVLRNDIDICFFTFCEESEKRTKKHMQEQMQESMCVEYDKEKLEFMQKAVLHTPMCRFTSTGSPWAKVYNRKLLNQYDIRFPAGMVKGEDHLFNLKVLEYAKQGLYFNQAFYHYRITATSARHKYNPDIIPIIRKQYEKIGEFLEKREKDESFKQLYYNAIYRRFMIDSMIDFCHADNPKSYLTRRKEYMNAFYSEPFLSARQHVKLDREWPLKERILGYIVNLHLFGIICILYQIKNRVYKAH